MMTTLKKMIIFLGQTTGGRHHDYTLLKQAFPPEFPWFELITLLVDLGFQGIQSDYEGDDIRIPHKKPRKSKQNPDPHLSVEQKQANQAVGRVRVLVENAIAGLKRFNILTHPFRNRSEDFDDDVIFVCAGLWNFYLS